MESPLPGIQQVSGTKDPNKTGECSCNSQLDVVLEWSQAVHDQDLTPQIPQENQGNVCHPGHTHNIQKLLQIFFQTPETARSKPHRS